jgi:hypothetical protein
MRSFSIVGSLITTLALVIGLAPSGAQASDTIRCGNKLVMEGDSSATVRDLCGAPAEVAHSTILRRPSYVRHGRVYYLGDELVEVRVETWTYNFGPNKFMRRLRIVDGIVDDIETLGYGHNPPLDN